MRAIRWVVLLAAFGMLFSFSGLFVGCSEDDESTPSGPNDGNYTVDSKATCQGCHTNEDMLKATIDETEEVAQVAMAEGHPVRVPSGEG